MNNKKQDHREIPQLWSSISHEIRTPLNVIKGMTDISESEMYDISMIKENFTKIKESADDMQLVVNALIDYAAITQRNMEILHEKMDFKTLITNVAMRSYVVAKAKKCHFNMHVKEVTEESLIGDEARISQVLVALLNVVIRYTNKDGIIDFTVQQSGISATKVFMRFCLRSTALQFPDEIINYLNDNSLYMNPDLLNPIGTFGLSEMNALYISYLMNGVIKAANKPGDYSEIVFDMEFGRIESSEDSPEGVKIFADQRILIVADTKEICHERGRMLADMGMDYAVSTDSEDALEQIGEAENENSPFTICIIDWDMKKQKCIQLIHDIREIFGRELVIMATAHDPSNHKKEALHYGADYVIDRTIFRSTLFDALMGIENGEKLKEEEARDIKYDFNGKRVLVAEDVALNMEVITKLLTKVNINVTCVENGVEAVLQFERKPEHYFDAILLDINMPVMDGYKAAESIRASHKEDASTVPIYAMTANAFKEDVQQALDAGMDGHIAKPIDINVLYKILNQIFEGEDNLIQSEGNPTDLELENQMLRDWAERDPLTGCLNRRGFEARINELVQSDKSVAYLAIDLDDFKYINDHFGHEIGDKILIKVVRQLKKKFRTSDYIIRLGGDEFAVVLVGYEQGKKFLINRVEELNDELLHPDDELPPITVSVGAVVSTDVYSHNLSMQADVALYQSKNLGKAMCSIYEDEIERQKVCPEDNTALYMEELHYYDKHIKVMVSNGKQLRSMLMMKNKPVAFVTGFQEPNLPVYSYSGFFLEHLGYTSEEFIQQAVKGFLDVVHPDDRDCFMQIDTENKLFTDKIRIRNKDGNYIWFNAEYILTKTTENKGFWMASLKNIEEDFVGTVCSDDYRVVALIKPKQDSVTFEKGAYLISENELDIQKKYNYSSLIASVVSDCVRDEERDNYLEKTQLSNIVKKLEECGMYEFIVYQKRGNSDYAVVRHKYRYLSERSDTILCTWEMLDHWVETDDVTDVLNEQGFYRTCEKIMKNETYNRRYVILYFNISGFKAWNSTLGKEGADKLLKEVALQIQNSKLKPLAVGRLFSDHFVCMIQEETLDTDDVSCLCNSRLQIDERNVSLRMRCGIFYILNQTESIRSMCDKAKLAKTQVKNEYAIPYHIFDENLNQTYLQQMHVLNHVGQALKKNEIKVYYQPVVDTKTKEIVSAEALIRWILPGNYVLSPSIFVPALEEQGHISDVDAFAHKKVCYMLQKRMEQNKKVVPVSVNMSRMDFLNDEFIKRLKDLIMKNAAARKYLRMEVTESAFVEVGPNGEELLHFLHEQGIEILMDDFGTGFSSLAGLTNRKFQVIKLDRSIINGIGNDDGSEAIIQSVVSMCHTLHMQVVAEGVETEEQYQFLLKADCDFIQGFYFYKPIPEAEFLKLLD